MSGYDPDDKPKNIYASGYDDGYRDGSATVDSKASAQNAALRAALGAAEKLISAVEAMDAAPEIVWGGLGGGGKLIAKAVRAALAQPIPPAAAKLLAEANAGRALFEAILSRSDCFTNAEVLAAVEAYRKVVDAHRP